MIEVWELLVCEYEVLRCAHLSVACRIKSWNVPSPHSNERTWHLPFSWHHCICYNSMQVVHTSLLKQKTHGIPNNYFRLWEFIFVSSAAITKYRRLSGINSINWLLSSMEAASLRSAGMGVVGSCSVQAPVPGFQMAVLSLCLLVIGCGGEERKLSGSLLRVLIPSWEPHPPDLNQIPS